MQAVSKISFSIKDSVLGSELSPSNLTLPLLSEFIGQVSLFLRGKSRKDLGEVKTSIAKGSLRVIVENFSGQLDDVTKDYMMLSQNQALEAISDPVRAKVVEQWQVSVKNNSDRRYNFFIEAPDMSDISGIEISNETNFSWKKYVWVNVELYLYGRVFDLGGKNKPNVHVELENGKTIKIGTRFSTLTVDSENRLYKDQLVRVKAKKNIITQELKEEQLIAFENYNPKFNEEEFEKISRKATIAWKSIPNATKWVEQLRGNYD